MKTTFKIWRDGDTKEDAAEILSTSHAEAAGAWAKQDDQYSAEYSIAGGEEAVIHVSDGQKTMKFLVTGEACPVYYAREID